MPRNLAYQKTATTQSGHTTFALQKKIIEITKSESKITYLEKSAEYDFLCDNSKAIKDLDFNPMVSIEEGLVDEMLWYEKEIQKQSNNE